MFRSGRLLPGLMSAAGPHSTVSPCLSRAGAMMYRFSPSAKCSSAIREVRFGSYSMCATLAGTPSLSARRKSMIREARLCPPPWWRAGTFPCTLRPPRPCRGRTSDFSGWSRVTSAKSATLEPRRPGVVGLYLRIAITDSVPVFYPWSVDPAASGARAPEDLDAVARRERHDGALGVLALAHAGAAAALALALAVDRVDAGDLHVEDLLDSDLDLRLVGLGQHDERVLVVVEQPVALLRDDRGEQDVPGVADGHAFSSVVSSVGAVASAPALAASACSAGAFAASSAVAGAAASAVAAAFVAGAFLAAAFLAGAGSAGVSARSRSVVPSPSIDGIAPGMSGVVRSGFSTPVPAARGPLTNSASASSVKMTSSALSTS